MKNKYVPLLITLPLLIGCKYTYNYHKYTGAKIVLDYVEEGALVEITPSELLSFTENQKSMICLFGIEKCSSCNNVKKNLQNYSVAENCNTYWVNAKKALENKDDIDALKKATSGYYEWGEKESYPLVYFFFKGDVAFRCGEEDVTTFITNYVEVAPKS